MITDFRKFNFKDNFWYIKGNVKEITDIMEKFIKTYKISKDKIKAFYSFMSYEKDIKGLYFSFNNSSVVGVMGWDFYAVENINQYINDLVDGKEFFKDDQKIYQGELKIVDDKLILDTFEIDTDKYNL